MYKYIGRPYTFNEFLYGSEIIQQFNKYLVFLEDFRFHKLNIDDVVSYCDTDDKKGLMCNCFIDALSFVLLEPDNFGLITDKIKTFSELCIESHLLLDFFNDMLDYCNNIPTLGFPKYDVFYLEKIKALIFEMQDKCKNEFYSSYNITAEKNSLLLKDIKGISMEHMSKLLNFMDAHLTAVRESSFKSAQRFESLATNHGLSFSFNVTSSQYQMPVRYSPSDKVLLFDRLMNIQNYEEISQRTKASILSILLNESEHTIRTYLKMLDKRDSESNTAFNESKTKIASLFKAYKIK